MKSRNWKVNEGIILAEDMAKKPVKETIHAKGIDISIYTEDFRNEYISLTDIARYKKMFGEYVGG